ncbi:MAG: hypothetical protein ACO1N0_03400 [Fluviicola sp.]
MKSIVFALLFLSSFAHSQKAVKLLESSLKLGGSEEKEFYFGFAEGDEIVLDVEVLKGKSLVEVEVANYPNSTQFSQIETKKIKHKTFLVSKIGIYKFRLTNKGVTEKECQINIQRIPASEKTQKFNSEVYWRTVTDTIDPDGWEEYSEKSDTTFSDFFSTTVQISSQHALNGNKPSQVVSFDLPANTIAWSYYLVVGEEGQKEYDQSKADFIRAGSKVVGMIPTYGPMAALALTGVNYMSQAQGKDNVKYYFLSNREDVPLFNNDKAFKRYKTGDVISEAAQMKTPLSGTVFIGLVNDNTMDPIKVTVKATAVMVEKKRIKRSKPVVVRKEAYLKD